MPDWRAITAQHLTGLQLPDARREEVVQELSEHLEDEFAALRERLPEDEAQRQTLNLLARSDTLIREIGRAEREDPMNQTARIFLCGALMGGIWGFLLSLVIFVFALGGIEFAAAVETAPSTRFPFIPILHVAIGIWTIWLYTAIRPRYGPGPKTAAIAGFALWVIGRLVDALWVSHGLLSLPASALLPPVAVSLPVIIAAAVAAAWPYELSERKPSQALKAT